MVQTIADLPQAPSREIRSMPHATLSFDSQESARPVAQTANAVTAIESETRVASTVHLVGSGKPHCGIGDFSSLLLRAMNEMQPDAHRALVLEPGRFEVRAIWRGLGAADVLVANFPVVAWKRALFSPFAAFAFAALRGRGRVVILHEWGSMHRLRRAILRPILMLAQRIVVASPQIRDELAADPLIGFLGKRAALMPLPPNLARPEATIGGPLRDRLAASRAAGRLVLGHFGSIYPGKQPEAVLAIAAALKARGCDPLLVFIGSFIKASDGIEDVFHASVERLGLSGNVLVTGFIAGPQELFGLFDEVDAFAYVLPEGLTARRSSVLACVQAGRPVVVTEPVRAGEFDHHPRFQTLLDEGAIVLAPREAGADRFAELVLAARERPSRPFVIDVDEWFKDAAALVLKQCRALPSWRRV